MVANAAICRVKPFVDITTEEFESELSINLIGEQEASIAFVWADETL